MERYKYQFKRIELDAKTAERSQNFDKILSKAIRHNKFLAIRNYLVFGSVFTVLVLVTYGIWDYSADPGIQSTFEKQTQQYIDEQKPVTKDSLVSIEQKEIIHEEKNAPDEQNTIPKEIPSQQSINTEEAEENDESNFKISEQPIVKNEFIQAEPAEGFESLYKHLSSSFQLPRDLEITPEVKSIIVSFVVDEDGNVSSVEVENSVHPVLDSIAVSCIEKMPKWKPATLNGQPIKTNHKIPLYFQTNNP